ncbi:MAG: hypothetical protein K2X93_00815 [Candidatus Obscuribacterales bacterium]|nr:hypothetical protein [Candidatus Obscuribacterales bacterium]
MVLQDIGPDLPRISKTDSDTAALPSVLSQDGNKLPAPKKSEHNAVLNEGFPHVEIEDLDLLGQQDLETSPDFDLDVDSEEQEQSKPSKDSSSRNKTFKSLLEKLNSEEWPVREQASKDLVKEGSKYFELLVDARRNHPELEVRGRAGAAVRAILNNRPAALNQMGDMLEKGLGEVAKTGRLSKETRNEYESFIKTADVLKLSRTEEEERREFAKPRFDKETSTERARMRETLSLRAMGTAPSAQARLDYANLHIASGDKNSAVKVLTEAVQKDPSLARLGESDTLRKLARESDAINDKDFIKAMSMADNESHPAKDWTRPEAKIVQEIGHLREQTSRFGMTKANENEWNKLVKDLDKRAQNEPALRDFLKLQLQTAKQNMVEQYGADGKPQKAWPLLAEMVNARQGGGWAESPWLTNQLRRQDYEPPRPTGEFKIKPDGTLGK